MLPLRKFFDHNVYFSKIPRGIRGYILIGGEFLFWKVAGNFAGEDFPDKVRGPLNEGGLYVERIGKICFIQPLLLCSMNRCPSSWLYTDRLAIWIPVQPYNRSYGKGRYHGLQDGFQLEYSRKRRHPYCFEACGG